MKNVQKFVVENDVPMPKAARSARGGMVDTVLDSMQVGSSFFWDGAKKANAYGVVRSWAIKKQKETGSAERIKFVVAPMTYKGVDGVRVWRKA